VDPWIRTTSDHQTAQPTTPIAKIDQNQASVSLSTLSSWAPIAVAMVMPTPSWSRLLKKSRRKSSRFRSCSVSVSTWTLPPPRG
jgi:hypothetical protein